MRCRRFLEEVPTRSPPLRGGSYRVYLRGSYKVRCRRFLEEVPTRVTTPAGRFVQSVFKRFLQSAL